MQVSFLLTLACLASGDVAVDFDNEVIPILTKAGCNTGACHGAAVGRGGFRLSLYGGDAAADFESIVRELEGRRVNLALPEQSLLVLKPTESIEHGGGTRLEYEGVGATLLARWIGQGATRVRSKRLRQFQVTPSSHLASVVGETLALQAHARFDDGSSLDVTRWTVFTADDPASVAVDPQTAVATFLRRGRHIVIARYLDRVVPIEIMVPLADEVIELSSASRVNFIDELVLQKLETLRIPLSPPADDATFVRRVTLDLTGRLPTADAVRAFLMDAADEKRQRWIDRLLASEEFNDYWTMQLAQLLRIRSQPQDTQGAKTYYTWLRDQVARGVPYDALARQVLVATGNSHEYGPANFYRTVPGPREQAEFTSELFMGSRLRCANCHNHPLDRWTQDDYHGLAAIFAKLERGRVIKLTPRGEVTHPRTGEAAIPRIPGETFLPSTDDGRVALAEWLTRDDNPFFAKAIVNRLWKAMLGRGLVEPADDFRDTNPATHPELLESLADDFIEQGYDLRHTLRRIAVSATYQRSGRATPDNALDDRFYSHAVIAPLEPEVLADAISDVIGLADRYGEQPLGTRTVSLFDANIKSEALDILGRCSREESCETPVAVAGGLTQKLHMFNGDLLNQRLAQPNSFLAQRLAADQSADEIVEQFYVRALARPPSQAERSYWRRTLAEAGNAAQQRELLEDFVWSLLTCQEFVNNH